MVASLKSLETRIPPLLVMLLFANIMLLFAELQGLPFARNAYALGLSVLFSGAGLLFMVWGVVAFRRAHTTLDPQHPERSEHLVQTGIFAITRNPIYVGMLMLLIAWGFVLADVFALLSSYFFLPYMNRFQIEPEERMLEQKFGTDYLVYCVRVHRWLFNSRKTP